jgi:hypothetical protein
MDIVCAIEKICKIEERHETTTKKRVKYLDESFEANSRSLYFTDSDFVYDWLRPDGEDGIQPRQCERVINCAWPRNESKWKFGLDLEARDIKKGQIKNSGFINGNLLFFLI